MLRKPILTMGIVLMLASLACRAPAPSNHLETGPTETKEISVQSPDDAESTDLELEFGAGELNIEPGAASNLVDGIATYNVEGLAPTVEEHGGTVVITQGDIEDSNFWNFEGDLKNEWNLKLGSSPLRLRITAGAYEGDYELGGLAIERLTVQDGASDVNLGFGEPNLIEMSLLRYQTGASTVRLTDLANANFEKMEFQGGAGDYVLDFGGKLQRDAEVTIDAGISSVRIVVPEGMDVVLTFDGGLSNVDVYGNWEEEGNQYVHSGSGPKLTIQVKMGAGNLELDN